MPDTEILRVCRVCCVEKPLAAYSRLSTNPEGRQTTCKTCAADYQRFRRAAFRERVKKIEIMSLLRNLDKRRASVRRYATSDAGRQNAILRTKARRKKYPERVNAMNAVARALRRGILTKGPCEVCATTTRIEAHHPDYTKPLDVMWLCRIHHREQHLSEQYKKYRSEVTQLAQV